MMNRVLTRILPLALVGILLFPALSLAQLTRGIISGTIRDQSGALVPGATVTATNVDTGVARTGVTNEQGFYRIPALEPGRYTVKIDLSGFKTVERTGVTVPMSTEVTVGADLEVATVGETVTVTAEAEAVQLNKSNPTVGQISTGRQAVELPLNANRDINQLALLAPNTFSAPGSTQISANGQRARNNNFTIDGSDNNDASVTLSTLDLAPEAIAEYQIQTNAYNVEFGRNSGAQLNVVTKSGTNTFRGEAWDYYRTAGLNALDNREKAAELEEPTRLVRHQAGASLGGPILKDRLFFFGLVQRDSIRTGDALGDAITIPTPEGFAALSSVPLRAGQSQQSRQAILDSLGFLRDVYAKNPVFTDPSTQRVNGVSIPFGTTSVGYPVPSTYWTGLGRIDWQMGANDSATLRYTSNNNNDTNLISNCDFGAIFCGDQAVKDQNFAATHTHLFSGNLLNEARVSFIKRDLQFPENAPDQPTAGIGGLWTVGGLANFPQGRVQKSWQFQEVLTWNFGRHNFKFGGDVRHIDLDNSAAFDSKGTYTFANFEAFMNNTATQLAQALQTSSFVAKQWQIFAFAQDDFRITPDFVLNLGLRYEISEAPFGFFGATEQRVKDALVPGPAQKDTNNWAPRVGFAWSPSRGSGFFGDGKFVLRGGYGVSYDVLFYNILTVNGSNYPRVVVGQAFNVQDVYPAVAPTTGSATFNPLATFVNSPENLQNPKTHFYSLSAQREFWRDFVLEVGYTGSTGRSGIGQLQANYAVLSAAQAETVRRTGSPTSIPSVQARRLFPQYGSRVIIGSDTDFSKSQYHAGFLSLQKRMSHGLQFGISYTRSQYKSDNDESLGVAAITGSSPQIPQDYANLDAEWSLSVFDRPNRFVANYIYEIPGVKKGFLKWVTDGWQLAGVTQYQSGQPLTIQTGIDTNGNGGGGDRPNLASGSLDWDENHKEFTNNGKYEVPLGANGRPLLYSLGNGMAERNAERGAGFWRTDLSLLKRFSMDRYFLTLRVDALNVFNQDEYANPVANMNSVNFGKNLNNWGNRSITLSAKLSF
jgi:hypothetical protein